VAVALAAIAAIAAGVIFYRRRNAEAGKPQVAAMAAMAATMPSGMPSVPSGHPVLTSLAPSECGSAVPLTAAALGAGAAGSASGYSSAGVYRI
jgi:ABC-type Co2+ transport system permease subunit